MNLVSLTDVPNFLSEGQIKAPVNTVQDHCPDHIRVLSIELQRMFLSPHYLPAHRVVTTIQREGDPGTISFWSEVEPKPGFHWFPMQMVISKIGLLA